MKLVFFIFSFIFIIGCKVYIENSKDCKGYPKTLSKALKKPEKAKYVSVGDYFDSLFPSVNLAKLNCLECLYVIGPNSKYSFKNSPLGKPTELKIDSLIIRKLKSLKHLEFAYINVINYSGLSYLKNLELLSLNIVFMDTPPRELLDLPKLEVLSLRCNKIKH